LFTCSLLKKALRFAFLKGRRNLSLKCEFMCGSSLVTGSAKWGLEGGNGIYWVLPNGSMGGYLGPPPWDCAFLLGRKNGSWGQFHQLAYSKLLCVQMIWPLTSISPTKLCPTLRAHSTRSYPKFYAVHYMLCVSKISVNLLS